MSKKVLILVALLGLLLATLACIAEPTPTPAAEPVVTSEPTATIESVPYSDPNALTWDSIDCQLCTLWCPGGAEGGSCIGACQAEGHCPW